MISVGVLPFRIETRDKEELTRIGLSDRFAHMLSFLLKRSEFKVKTLEWTTTEMKITISGYRKLLATAQKDSILALVPMNIGLYDFKMWKLPKILGIDLGFVNIAMVRIGVEGGLIDVVRQEALADLRGKRTKVGSILSGAGVERSE